MSDVALCPSCNGKAKIKKDKSSGKIIYSAIEDEEAFQKIGKLKKALTKAREKVKVLEEELSVLKAL